jgi:hypothetical protein
MNSKLQGSVRPDERITTSAPMRLLSQHHYEYGLEVLEQSDKRHVVLCSYYGSNGEIAGIPPIWQWELYKHNATTWLRILHNGTLIHQMPYRGFG